MSNPEFFSQQQQLSLNDKFQTKVVISYDEIAALCEQLGYRDKLRLAQLLIQLARKEEETQNPQSQIESYPKDLSKPQNDSEVVQYVFERIIKLKPRTRKTLKNSIGTMFQSQGGISEAEQERILSELQRLKHIQIDAQNRVTYL
ncbi:hypothetical protein NG798_05945 [Ancylothrix sp. C2]|uniref:hypothetical protein n=1 Tax=Ancylothrix sp. D3o TaxID=2953691 RepID=UPI0021BB8A9D|nr:hypothetical protein [Ancylothrix sp. D3o]MCT7949323.1 hypothetical protein [Ancylothrix sp. D3o]